MSWWKRALGAVVFVVCLWEEWSLFCMPASALGGTMTAVAMVMAVMVVGYSGLLLSLGKDPRRPNDG
jgi:hypothetical protein